MKRFLSLFLILAMILPLAIGGITIPAAAADRSVTPAAGKYVITGGGIWGMPEYALDTTTYADAEIGTVLASVEAPDTGIAFSEEGGCVCGSENFVATLVLIEDNKFAIRLNNGRYLAAAGTTNLVSYKNYQYVPEAQWTIEIDNEGNWMIRNVHDATKYLGFSHDAKYFRTFTTGGVLPKLYTYTPESNSDTHEVTMLQSVHSSGTGTITATYRGMQYVFPEDPDHLTIPTIFTVDDGARIALYFEPSSGSELSKVRVNGIEQTLIENGGGFSLTLNNIIHNTNISAVWVNGAAENRGDPDSAVIAEPYDNATFDLEGTGSSDPISTARINTADILEGALYADKSVHYNSEEGTFTNQLSLNSVAFEVATSESVVIPMDVVIILDISGSMNREVTGSTTVFRMTEIAEELNNLTRELIEASPNNRIGVATFSGGTTYSGTSNNARIVVPLAEHTSVNFNYTNQNTGSGSNAGNLKGSLSISANDVAAVTQQVIGGTYTQGGIGKALEMLTNESERTFTFNGQTYDRTPVVLLVTDGVPTWGADEYTATDPGDSDYGTGSEEATTGMGNSGYYTVLAAQYLGEQAKQLYNNSTRSRFYTIGVDTHNGTYGTLAAAVLDPTSDNIAALPNNAEPYRTLRNALMSNDYRDQYYVDGQYVSYADKAYDVTSGTGGLRDAFREILTEAQAVVSYIMPVVDGTNVDFYDTLGQDVEFKTDPVLNYGGQDYAPVSSSTVNGVTTYRYEGTVQAYGGGPAVSLAGVVATKEQDNDGYWKIHWSLPSYLVPGYIYDQLGDEYIPAQTVTMTYDVAPTDEALATVRSGRNFYSNAYDDAHHAYVTYQLNPDSPYYKTYYGGLNPELTLDKLVNASGTDPYIGDGSISDGVVSKQLGNNGVMSISAKRADVTVRKLWKNPDGSLCEAPYQAEIYGELWQRKFNKTTGAWIADVKLDDINLAETDNWEKTWENLVLRDDNYNYTYYGKETQILSADAYDYYTIEEMDADGNIRISNYYNRMTITVNTDWYYNGENETDTIENRTIVTLYYKDSSGALIPVSGVEPIVFDSTEGQSEDWNDRWTDLIIRHPDGRPVEYVIEQQIVNEDPRGEHTTFYTVDLDPSTEGTNPRESTCDPVTGIVNPDPVVQIDNYLENPPIKVTVNKVWADNSGSTQDDITVSLYRTATPDGVGRLMKTATFGKAENWTYTFDNLAPGYYYYVREAKVSGYTVAYSGVVSQADDPVNNNPSITITNTPYPDTGLSVEKEWQTDSGTRLLDASGMPAIKAKVWRIDDAVTQPPEYTVTIEFIGRQSRTASTEHEVAPEVIITGVREGGTATISFTNFSGLDLSGNNSTIEVTKVSGDGTLDTSAFTPTVYRQGFYYYSRYGGSISVSDVRSDVVIRILKSYNRNRTVTFANHQATTSTTGGAEPSQETTRELYQTVELSAANDWHVDLENLPVIAEEGYTTHNYTYYVEEESTTSFQPTYEGNDTENGITSGLVVITNTVYPEILPDAYVFDFGLPMDTDVLDNDRKAQSIAGLQLTGLSLTPPSGVELNTGVSTAKKFGTSCNGTYSNFSIMDNCLRVTPKTTNVPEAERCYYEAFIPGIGYMYSYADIAPATNVHYEESFLANDGFEIVGKADTREQSDANVLYGKDDAYKGYEENSMGACYGVSVSDPAVQPTATFTFTGTGFDILSRCTPDSGVMVVEVRKTSDPSKPVWRFITDNYLGEDSLYQLPVVHKTDFPFSTYYVTVKAYYNVIFDHNLSHNVRGVKNLSGVLADLGWPEDAEYEYSPAADSADSAKRSIAPATEGSYNVYIDGVRIYNPLGTSPEGVGGALYKTAGETDPEYIQIRKTLLDAGSWDSVGNGIVNPVMYIADKTTSSGPSDPFNTNGVYLSTSGTLRTEVDDEDGRTYLLDVEGERIQFRDMDVWTEIVEGVRKYYYGETELGKAQLNTLELAYYDNIYRANGPENEVYLQNGGGIAFAVESNSGVHLSAKSPNGKPVTLCAYDGEKWNAVATITSATEQFYDLTPYTTGSNVIVKCVADGDGILALCQIKTLPPVAGKRSVHVGTDVGYAAIQAMESEADVIDVHDHIWTVASTTATCTEPGVTTYRCSVCGAERTQTVRATGHTYEVETHPAVSCISNGEEIFTCVDCGKTVTKVLPRERHTYTQQAVAATETSPAYTLFTCSVCGFSYKAVEGSVYEPADYARLSISSVSLRLDEDIDVLITAGVPANCSDVYMIFSFVDEEYVSRDYTIDAEGRYCFTFSGVTPQYMNEPIGATVYCADSNGTYAETLEDYSVRTYCERMLERYPDNAKLKTLLSDLLVYGAAAQNYVEYATDALVTDGLELTPSVFPAEPVYTPVSFSGEASAEADWTSASLILRSNLAARFTFTAEDVSDLTVRISINGRTQDFTADRFTDAGDGSWYVEISQILATEFNDAISASFLKDGEPIGRTVNYSVNAYVAGACEGDSTLAALVRALYNYGCSASAYTAG